MVTASPPAVQRDRFGRYLLPDPDGPATVWKAWERATAWAEPVSPASPGCPDTGLGLRVIVDGLDRGDDLPVSARWADPVAAYQRALADHGVAVLPEYVGRVAATRVLGLADVLDRIVRLPDGRLYVAAVEVVPELPSSWGALAVRLAVYANADALWNAAIGGFEPMPAVERDQGVVVWLPADGRCALYDVNIDAGWEMAQVCGTVRGWRLRIDLASPLPRLPSTASLTRMASDSP